MFGLDEQGDKTVRGSEEETDIRNRKKRFLSCLFAELTLFKKKVKEMHEKLIPFDEVNLRHLGRVRRHNVPCDWLQSLVEINSRRSLVIYKSL